MASFVKGYRQFLTVRDLYSSDTLSNIVDFLASSIEILVNMLEDPSRPWHIDYASQTDILRKRLKFLIVFLRDIPFRCTEIEGSKNILEEIESIAKEAKLFLNSFSMTYHVIVMERDLLFPHLLSKFEVAEAKMKKHCTMVFDQPKFTTSNLTSASIYIVDSLLDDLNHLVNHKADLVVEVKDQIKTLYDELYSSRSMLREIELQQNKELVEHEMQLIYLAYQVEYIIACFAVGEVPVWYLTSRLASFIEKSNPTQASLTKIKLINSGIRGVQVAESCTEVSSSQVTTKSILEVEEIIVGFKETTKQVAEQVFGGPNNLQIISIVGMGGLGKTTLARKLYNHSNAILHFDKRAWCVVSQTYQKRKLLIYILSCVSSLNKNEISEMEDHQLANRIYKSLKRTRYLLVVDDIWEKNVWDDLKRYFPNDTNGSRILFTSRSKDVSLQTSSEPIIHDLPLLTDDECWDLLQKKVFPNSICPQELQDVGKEIVKNCKGLPLVVVGIAAVLENMDKKKSIWQEVATNLTSYVFKDQKILELSYEHLPSHLKPCFLYLGVFGEDEEIPARKLLSLWVSCGFIPRNEHKILEDIAEDFLLQLINRSMVQIVKRRSDKRVKSFTMHDLMRDMCLRLADRENFVKNFRIPIRYEQHHHICIHSDPFCYHLTSGVSGVHIRSLFCEFDLLYYLFTSSMKRLRVLKLSVNNMKSNGSALRFLVQLKHLECAGSLYNFGSHINLEFLSVSELLKSAQLDMPNLRHLYFSLWRYLDSETPDISQLHSLQTLSGIVIHNMEDEDRLRHLSQLHLLKCRYGKSWDECSPDLISLTQLVSLTISGFFTMIKLKAVNFPIHIKKLSISLMVLSCGLLSSIGTTLHHLEILKLFDVEFEEMIWNTNDDEFKRLKLLKLNRVAFEAWNTSEDHFPVLEQLVLRSCPRLKLVPSELGYIPTMQRIEVYDCKEAIRNSVKHIQEEQEAEGNDQLEVIMSNAYEDF